MNYLEILKEYFVLERKAKLLAEAYVNGIMDHGGSLYSDVRFTEEYFSFTYGPSTHGLCSLAKLPVNLINSESWGKELADIIENDKVKLKAEREKVTCKTCGHINSLFLGENFELFGNT